MKRVLAVWLGLTTAGLCLLPAQAAAPLRLPARAAGLSRVQSPVATPAALALTDADRALLTRYCFTCHNSRLKTAGLSLDALDLAAVAQAAPTWEKVVSKLRGGMMPPAGRPRPDPKALDDFASS